MLTTWRVRRGIRLLDTTLGRDVWLNRVDVNELRVWSGVDCPLAQATGQHFSTASYHLGFDEGSRVDGLRLALLGFMNLPGEPWGKLTSTWRREIIALQSERARTLVGAK
jgi:hypothetical protein